MEGPAFCSTLEEASEKRLLGGAGLQPCDSNSMKPALAAEVRFKYLLLELITES
jgi:hypothetical protein